MKRIPFSFICYVFRTNIVSHKSMTYQEFKESLEKEKMKTIYLIVKQSLRDLIITKNSDIIQLIIEFVKKYFQKYN